MVINQNKILKTLTGRAVLLAVLLAGIFMSCAKIEDGKQEGSGYISFQSISIDVSVNGESQTKANVPEADLPSADEFVITISGNAIDKDIVLEYNEYQDGPILLPVGTYTVSASCGSNGFDTPYFHKSKTVEIKEDLTETISLDNVPLANAMVMVTLPDMEKHLRDGVLTLSAGAETISVNAYEYHYVPVKENVPVTVSLSGTNTVGQPKTFSASLGVEAKHAYNVVFDLSLPDLVFANQAAGAIAGRLYLTSLASGAGLDQTKFDYKISSDGGTTWSSVAPVPVQGAKTECWLISDLDVDKTYMIKAVYGGMETESWEFKPSTPAPVTDFTISHDYSDNVLTGSTVTISGTNVSYTEMLKGLITDRGVKVVNSASTVVRTLSGAETGSIGATEKWPYLPQGGYTLNSFFKIGAEEVIYSTSSPKTSPAPTLTVTAYAETSYSRYTSSDQSLKAKANDAGTGDKVMNIQGKVSISDDILGNPNYSGLIEASLMYDNTTELLSDKVVSKNIFTAADQTGQSWQDHTVNASFTFDGVSDNDEVPCHVTGIPYTYDFYNKDLKTIQEAKWTTHNVEYTNNKCTIQYDGSNGYLISPKFYNPSDISISLQYSIQAQYYRAWSINVGSKSIELRVGVTSSNGNVASSYNRYTCSGTNNPGKSYSTYYNNDPNNIQSLSLPKDSYISFSHNNANVGGQIDYLCLYGFELKYLY